MIYQCTNESLKAIVAGLDVLPDDNLLVVGGSGDQAFALLEFAEKGKVTAVDNAPQQIDFIRQKAEALRIGDYESFFRVDNKEMCNLIGPHNEENVSIYDRIEKDGRLREEKKRQYFEENGNRLERIRRNLDNLIVLPPANIVGIARRKQGHSKVYLSNALGYRSAIKEDLLRIVLDEISQNLPKNGLIYVTNHDELFYGCSEEESNDLEIFLNAFMPKDPFEPHFLPPTLTLDRELSSRARDHEFCWRPAVYRKVEPLN